MMLLQDFSCTLPILFGCLTLLTNLRRNIMSPQKRLKTSFLAILYAAKCRKDTSWEKTYMLPLVRRRQDGILSSFSFTNRHVKP